MQSLKTYISILKTVKNRPTKYFFWLVALIVGLFMQAYMHNYNIVYIMMFLLVGVASASSIYGVFNLYHTQVKLLSSERFFANESSSYTLQLTNKAKHTIYDISLITNNQERYVSQLKAEQSTHFSITAKFDKRGYSPLPDITLNSNFPIPYELKYKSISLTDTLFVYAQAKGVSLFQTHNKNTSLNGEIKDFDTLSEFTQGDSTSSIYWPSLAKSSALLKKTYTYQEQSQQLHFSFHTLKGSTQERLSQLTLWVLECETHKLNFTLEIANETLDSKEHTVDEILTKIASY